MAHSRPDRFSPNCPQHWCYPDELANDLQNAGIPAEFIPEALACAWEYSRVVIPHFINYPRYIAFTRLLAIAVIAEFKGSLINVTSGKEFLGYDLEALLHTVFDGTAYYSDMCREFRCFLLFTTMKSSEARSSELYRRYGNCLAHSAKTWFRIRDCDALLRFTLAGALACNDHDQTWFEEDELQVLCEIGDAMYDAVAFYKHRAEGEIHSTFGYVNEALRKECYHRCRDILWALDVTWSTKPSHRCVINLLRCFGGPLQMMTHRYRFVEDELTIGQPETASIVQETRQNFKLWYRVDFQQAGTEATDDTALEALEDQELLFPGLKKIFHASEAIQCQTCSFPQSYGTKAVGKFSCVRLCDRCRNTWEMYLTDLPNRAARVFPCLRLVDVGEKDCLSDKKR